MASKNKHNHNYANKSASRVERIFRLLMRGIKANANKYNFNKIVNYQCKGYDLVGSSCNTHDSRRHFLVKNNHYDVWEVPAKSNKGLKMTGDFMVLIKNLDFGFWTIATMKHKFHKSNINTVDEVVSYHCYGEIEITFDATGNNISYYCICGGGDCCRGIRSAVFDSDNVRKEQGYHTTKKVIDKSFGIKLL